MNRLYCTYAARAIALLWAGFWVFFGVASGLGEKLTPLGIFIHALVPGLVFLGSVFAAWKWRTAGGTLLLLEGVFVAFAYPIWFSHMRFDTKVFIFLTMALPPMLAGLLLLIGGDRVNHPV